MKKITDYKLTEYDSRQISLMKYFVESYTKKKIPLAELIEKLRGLLDCLESVDFSWKQCFYDQWFVLEQMYAVALDENESVDKYEGTTSEAISNLQVLLGVELGSI